MSIRLFVALMCAMILSAANLLAQEQSNTNVLTQACRAPTSSDSKIAMPAQGECLGVVSTLLHFGTARLSICAPQGTTVEQARKVCDQLFRSAPALALFGLQGHRVACYAAGMAVFAKWLTTSAGHGSGCAIVKARL